VVVARRIFAPQQYQSRHHGGPEEHTAAIVVAVAGLVVTFVADHFVRPVLIGGATRLPRTESSRRAP
jgi:hypothetical protein